jgi:hypothetical protein
MKLFFVLIYLAAAAEAFSETLTFDDLSTSLVPVPNGYGGLNWNNFYVVNAVTAESPGSGYQNGIVSASNVVYDGYAKPAAITSSQAFNLDSAYLTAAFDDGLNLEVQGYSGSDLLYDNTYTVNTEGPLLVDFNYVGVTEVVFTPYINLSEGTSSQLVMDNLTVDVPEPGTVGLCLLGTVLAVVGNFRRLQKT